MTKYKSMTLVLTAVVLAFVIGTKIAKQPKDAAEIPITTTTTTTTTTTRPPMYELTEEEITEGAKNFNVNREAVIEAITYKQLYILTVQLAPAAETIVWNPGELSEEQMSSIEKITVDDENAYRYVTRTIVLTPTKLTEEQMQEITDEVELDPASEDWPCEVKFVTDYYNAEGQLQGANYNLVSYGDLEGAKYEYEAGMHPIEELLVN